MLASFVHSLPFNIDVLSCPEGVEAAQYMVARKLNITHWKEQTRTVILVHQPQRSTSCTQQGSANRKLVGFTQEPKTSLSVIEPLAFQMPVAELEEKTPKGKHPPLCHPRSFVEPWIQITQLRERNHLTSESFQVGIFFSPPIEGGTAVKFYPEHYFLFLKGRMKGIWRLRELFVPFPGRCVQCPYFSQDRAKYLMSTCPSFSDRCFAKGNSIVLWFCHVSQGKSIFHLGTQNLMGRLRASINVWNSQ